MAAPVLYLLIRLGRDRYLLEASQIIEIIPLVRLKALPGSPAGTAGLMNYRGTTLPVIDLALVVNGTATPESGASRIVVTNYASSPAAMHTSALGLLVPEARETLRLDPDSFVEGGIAADGAPYLGLVLASPDGVLQRVETAALLTPELRDALYRASEAA